MLFFLLLFFSALFASPPPSNPLLTPPTTTEPAETNTECFRGFSLGKSYRYEYRTLLRLGKHLYSGATIAARRTQHMLIDALAVVTPVAIDERGDLHVALTIESATVADSNGWASYSSDGDGGIDSSALDAQMLDAMSGDFYFTQSCDMHVHTVHYPRDEQEFAINFKQGLARSLSAKVASSARVAALAEAESSRKRQPVSSVRYSHAESDDFGDIDVTYEHDLASEHSSPMDGLAGQRTRVKRSFDAGRKVYFPTFRGLAPKDRHAEMDTAEKRDVEYVDGTVTSIDAVSHYKWPSEATLDPMKAEWESAKRENERRRANPELNEGELDHDTERLGRSSQGLEMYWYSEWKGRLLRVTRRPMAATERRSIRSFRADFLRKRHGEAGDDFVSTVPVTLTKQSLERFDAREDDRTLDEVVALLEELPPDDVNPEDEEGLGPLGTERHGDEAHAHHEASRPSSTWAFGEIGRRLRVDPIGTTGGLAKYLMAGSDVWYPEAVRHSLLNAIAQWGGAEGQLLLLEVARDEDQPYNARHVAYVALSNLKSPSAALVDELESQILASPAISHDKLLPHILLCYGSMASNLFHDGQYQRSHDMREFLFAFYTERTHDPEEQILLLFALNNTMLYVDPDDVNLRNVTTGKHLDLDDVLPFFSPDPSDWMDDDPDYSDADRRLTEDLLHASPLGRLDPGVHIDEAAARAAQGGGGGLHKRKGGKKGDRGTANGWLAWTDFSSYKVTSLSENNQAGGGAYAAANAFSACLPNCPRIQNDENCAETMSCGVIYGSDEQQAMLEDQLGPNSGFSCEGPACAIFDKDDLGMAAQEGEGDTTPNCDADGNCACDEGADGCSGGKKKRKLPLLAECEPVYSLNPGTYKGKPCSYYFYDNWVPRNPKTEMKKKLGSSKFYGMLEFALHGHYEGGSSRFGSYFELSFFVGGQASVVLMGKKIPVEAAYVRANISISSERNRCSYFSFGIMYMYFNKMYVFAIGDGDCQYVESTCKPWMPYDKDGSFGKLSLAKVVFFEWSTTFMVGPIPCVVAIQGFGELAVYYDIRMIFSPPYYVDREGYVSEYCMDAEGRCSEVGSIDFGGGSALNGIVEPSLAIKLTASFGVSLVVVSAGLGIEITIIEMGLPMSVGLNFVTQTPCVGAGIRVGALGGRFFIWVQFGLCSGWVKLCFRFEKTIYQWDGLSWECPLFMKFCCKECPGACNNAWCNYKVGECVCNDAWGGLLCNMECPPGCDWAQAPLALERQGAPNDGVKCEVNPDPSAFTDFCECYYGYFGYNCLVSCPGMILEPGLPPKPCNDHGECGDFGYQRSDGFGVYVLEGEEDLPALMGVCKCDENYFKDDCSISCPIDPDTGRACKNGGRCVFDGFSAYCMCLKGYAGPDCEAQCPLFRGSPCGYRGDCVWEDGSAKCHCHFGFSGEGCGIPSNQGSGRSLRFEGHQWHVEFSEISRIASTTDRYTTGFWFKVDAVDEPVTLLQWRHARVILEPPGQLMFCDARNNTDFDGCFPSVINPVPLHTWQFVYVSAASYQLAHDKHLWHGVPPGSPCPSNPDVTNEDGWCVYSGYEHENADFPPVKGSMIIGDGLWGEIDNVMVVDGTPTKSRVLEYAHQILVPDEEGLLLYFLCDEGRGKVVYDEVNMLAASFTWPDPTYDWLARGPDAIWGNPSGVTLEQGAVYTNRSEVVELGTPRNVGGERDICFSMDLAGLSIVSASLHFKYVVETSQLCPINVDFIGKSGMVDLTVQSDNGDGSAKLYNGEATEIIELPLGVTQSLRSLNCFKFKVGENAVDEADPCAIAVDEAFLDIVTRASDVFMEYTGRPDSFVYTDNHPAISGPFTIEMWMIRPPLLHSQQGLLLSLVDKGLDPGVSNIDGPFLLYETGFPEFGMQYQYAGQSNKVEVGGWNAPFKYRVPTNEWVHFAVAVRPSTSISGHCEHRFTINGLEDGADGELFQVGSRDGASETIHYPGLEEELGTGYKPNYCTPGGALQGWGSSSFRLRFGAKFLGAMNDVMIHNSYVDLPTLQTQMNMYRDLGGIGGLLLAYDFNAIASMADPNNGGVVAPIRVPDRSGGGRFGIMTDGAHAGVTLAVPHDWNHCPGVTYQTPESVCGSDPTHSHGTCRKPRSSRDDRAPRKPKVSTDPATVTHTHSCECDPGYKLGYEKTCSIECPPNWQNPCSGHGTCVAVQASAGDQASGPLPPSPQAVPSNETDVTPAPAAATGDANIVDNTADGALVECLCDEGYVGASCEFECPGWSAVWNTPRRICAGFGVCEATVDGAYCRCFDTGQRYGEACEFIYGNEPDEVITQCGPCNDIGEVCQDNQCVCRPGYYRTFGVCLPVGEELAAHPSNIPQSVAVTASLGAILLIFGACLYTTYSVKYKPVT